MEISTGVQGQVVIDHGPRPGGTKVMRLIKASRIELIIIYRPTRYPQVMARTPSMYMYIYIIYIYIMSSVVNQCVPSAVGHNKV